MDETWDNSTRYNAINEALNRLPHDQVAIGFGFKLRHNPAACVRCRANIAILELAAIIAGYERKELEDPMNCDYCGGNDETGSHERWCPVINEMVQTEVKNDT